MADARDTFKSADNGEQIRTGSSPGSNWLVRLDGTRLVMTDPRLFENELTTHALLDRAFLVPEVRTAVILHSRNQIRIELTPLADSAQVWSRFAALMRADLNVSETGPRSRAKALDLVGPEPRLPVRVSRAGDTLTTFRVRRLAREQLRIGHPLLRRREVLYRFGELLRSIHGIKEVRLTALWASAIVEYDPGLIEAEQLLRVLETSWTSLVSGAPAPSIPKKLVIASGLLALSFFAQFFRPALQPWAVLAVVIYSAPNIIAALRDLARGRVGLSALYSAGLGFLLWTRLPFASSLIATFSQIWPALANSLAAHSERRLFAEHRRRIVWARSTDGHGSETIVDVANLTTEQLVIVRRGDYIPADGVVVEGLAAVEEDMLTGARGAIDKLAGDTVYAGTYVRDGFLGLRAHHIGKATASAALADALPHGALTDLPSLEAAEHIANRNARPALVASMALLALTRTPRLSQVIIRPDYATAPRLSAHLSALTALAESLAGSALARRPAALERLMTSDLFIFDDGVDF